MKHKNLSEVKYLYHFCYYYSHLLQPEFRGDKMTEMHGNLVLFQCFHKLNFIFFRYIAYIQPWFLDWRYNRDIFEEPLNFHIVLGYNIEYFPKNDKDRNCLWSLLLLSQPYGIFVFAKSRDVTSTRVI